MGGEIAYAIDMPRNNFYKLEDIGIPGDSNMHARAKVRPRWSRGIGINL
jgi:hypothetical protein